MGRLLIQAIFLLEQHIGHQTYAQNLQDYFPKDSGVNPDWKRITYASRNSFWGQLPNVPEHLRGSLIGRSQARHSLLTRNYDIAFFNTQVPAALAGRLIHEKPYVLATDITPLQYDRLGSAYGHAVDRFHPLARYKHRVNTRLFNEAARLLPWSQWAADSLIQDYGAEPDRVEVLAPGVDLERWRPVDREPGNKVRILFVGGDFYRKGGELLLQACQSFLPDQAELHIVTRSPLESRPGVQIYLDLKPNSDALIQLYQTSDIFVLPSQAEAFGIAAVEACACGLPVVVAQVGGLQNIVEAGETGFLVPPGDAHALSSNLKALVENLSLRQRMGAAARKRAKTSFDARRNASRVAEILCEVVGD